MATITVLIVEQDERYVDKLAMKFLEEMKDDISLEIITDMEYLKEYAATPRKVDVLLINENCITEDISKQNIRLKIILRETEQTPSEQGRDQQNIFSICKYSNLQEIYYRVQGKIRNTFTAYGNAVRKKDSSLLMVYSPIGGSGRTSVAMGICSALSEAGKKVLYVNVETIQNFQSFLNDKKVMENGFERHLSMHENGLLSYLHGGIGNEGFDYLRPTRYSTLSYGIKPDDYLYFFDRLLEAGFYEYVVVDTQAALDAFTCALMEKSDKVLLVAEQDALSVYKMERLLENIDYTDTDKFLFLCNKYRSEEDNHLLSAAILGKCTITEYIDYDEMLEQIGNLYNIRRNQMLHSTAYLLIG